MLDLYEKAYDDLYEKYINSLDRFASHLFALMGMEYEKSEQVKSI